MALFPPPAVRRLVGPLLLIAWLRNHDDPEGVFWRGIPNWLQHWLRESYYFSRFTQLTLNFWMRAAVGLSFLFSKPSLLHRYLYPKKLVLRGVRYSSAALPRRDRHLLLDVYAPKPGFNSKKAPVLVYIHGGVWTLSYRDEYRLMGERFADLGIVFVCPSYSLYPDGIASDQIDDVDMVLRWTRGHIARYGGDPSSIVLSGQSSGAHVAALCMLQRNCSVAGFVGLAGPYDPEDHNRGHETMRGVNEVSPLVPAMGGESEMHKYTAQKYVNDADSLPPVLLIHGKDDSVVPLRSSVNFFVSLRRAGHSNAQVLILPGVDHSSYLLSIMKGEDDAVLREMLRFVKRVSSTSAALVMDELASSENDIVSKLQGQGSESAFPAAVSAL